MNDEHGRNHEMKGSLYKVIGAILTRFPRLLSLALNLRLRIWQLKVSLRRRRYSRIPEVNKIYWIKPKTIEYALIFDRFKDCDKYRDRGKVIGGNWDLKKIRFEELGIGVYHGLEDRFIRKNSWEQTAFYLRVLNLVSQGLPLWVCRSKEDIDKRCQYLDSLFESIKNHGYIPRGKIKEKEGDPYEGEDEITLRVGRSGELLFEDGQHRLPIAKLLNLARIPVKITARHTTWYSFRKEILEYARINGGKIYHPITHPDLSDIPSVYGDERFKIIQQYLPMKAGTLLDIGAHWGYFCHKFEETGFDCYAVESDTKAIYFLKKLKTAENRKFRVISGSIFDYRGKNDFDVVLALNIFHHFIKTEETFFKLIELLKRLDMKVMFFQPELPGSPQMQGAYRNFACDEFVKFILDNSILNEANYIGRTDDRRPIFRLKV